MDFAPPQVVLRLKLSSFLASEIFSARSGKDKGKIKIRKD
jgi:hypothetical protein